MLRKREVRLCLVLVATVTMGSSAALFTFAQTKRYADSLKNQEQKVSVTLTIQDQTYCTTRDMRITVLLTIRNLSKSTLIFCRDCMAVGATYIGRNFADLNSENFVYDQYGIGWRKINVESGSSVRSPLIELSPGEDFSVRLNTYLDNFSENALILPAGQYLMVQVLRTWTDMTPPSPELRSKWRREGKEFWSDELLTSPVEFHIANSPETRGCSLDSV